MYFTNFKGIQEMGLICGGGLLLCLAPMMTLLPVLLLRGRQNVMDHQIHEDETRARIENIWLQRPVLVTGMVVVTCALAFTQIYRGNVKFDYNLMELQSPSLSSVVFEQKLTHADKSLLFGAVVATNLDHALLLEKQLGELTNTVADIEPPAEMLNDFIEQNQREKLGLIRAIKQEVAPLRFAAPDPAPVNLTNLSRTLFFTYTYVGNALEDHDVSADPELTKQFAALQQAIDNLRKTMLAGDGAAQAGHADKLAEFQQALFDDVRDDLSSRCRSQNDSRAVARGRFARRPARPVHRRDRQISAASVSESRRVGTHEPGGFCHRFADGGSERHGHARAIVGI